MHSTLACVQHSKPRSSSVFQSNQLEGTISPCSSGGGWSDIYRASLNAFSPNPAKKIAIKCFRRNEKPQHVIKAWIENELHIWNILHLTGHQNVASFLGVIEFESYNNRSFQHYIRPWPICDHYKNKDLEMFVRSKNPMERFDLLRDVVSGLNHMHNNSIVHGDLKASNVLVDDSGIARICDFGSSRIDCACTHHPRCLRASSGDALCTCNTVCPCVSGKGSSCTCNEDKPCARGTGSPCTCNIEVPTGTELWGSPERLFDEEDRCTKASDVWAFGCLALEVQFGMKPYRGDPIVAQLSILDNRPPITRDSIDSGDPLSFDNSLSQKVWDMMQECWNFDATLRPSTNRLLVDFEVIEANDTVQLVIAALESYP